MYQLSKRSSQHLEGVNPLLIDVIKLALRITKVDFGIPPSGGKRTAKQQKVLFAGGLSECDGYEKLSKHQSGDAFDVFAYVDGKASWDIDDLNEVATAILAAASQLGVSLVWGGHFKSFTDRPHFEITRCK
jgi:peptidoglycan L-alanyl-D-glutamate endopeptidase CwlK